MDLLMVHCSISVSLKDTINIQATVYAFILDGTNDSNICAYGLSCSAGKNA